MIMVNILCVMIMVNFYYIFHFPEPPSAPRIYDDNAREIIGRAGPYREGDKPVFNCVVTGG